jgi:hypothetical protein
VCDFPFLIDFVGPMDLACSGSAVTDEVPHSLVERRLFEMSYTVCSSAHACGLVGAFDLETF